MDVTIMDDTGRLFKTAREMLPADKAWGGTFEVWGKQWDERKQRWSKDDNLYYCNVFIVIGDHKP